MPDPSHLRRKWSGLAKAAGALTLFALLGAILVGLGYQNAIERIKSNEREALLHQLLEIVPREQCDNNMLTDTRIIQAPDHLGSEQTTVYRARTENGPFAAIFSPVIASGYNGDIHLLVGINTNGSIAGVRVLKHRETPGLGDKIEIERDPWVLDFDGASLLKPKPDDWRVERDGGVFDQFTGATITPRAIVLAVKKALEYFQKNQERVFSVGESDDHLTEDW